MYICFLYVYYVRLRYASIFYHNIFVPFYANGNPMEGWKWGYVSSFQRSTWSENLCFDGPFIREARNSEHIRSILVTTSMQVMCIVEKV